MRQTKKGIKEAQYFDELIRQAFLKIEKEKSVSSKEDLERQKPSKFNPFRRHVRRK